MVKDRVQLERRPSRPVARVHRAIVAVARRVHRVAACARDSGHSKGGNDSQGASAKYVTKTKKTTKTCRSTLMLDNGLRSVHLVVAEVGFGSADRIPDDCFRTREKTW